MEKEVVREELKEEGGVSLGRGWAKEVKVGGEYLKKDWWEEWGDMIWCEAVKQGRRAEVTERRREVKKETWREESGKDRWEEEEKEGKGKQEEGEEMM